MLFGFLLLPRDDRADVDDVDNIDCDDFEGLLVLESLNPLDERATWESLEKHISLLCSKPTAYGDSERPNFDQKRLGFKYFQILKCK